MGYNLLSPSPLGDVSALLFVLKLPSNKSSTEMDGTMSPQFVIEPQLFGTGLESGLYMQISFHAFTKLIKFLDNKMLPL